MADTLTKHWLPIFAQTPVDSDLADSVLDDLGDDLKFDWNISHKNTAQSFTHTIACVTHDMGTGEDGIPYSGYGPIKRLVGRVFSAVNRRIVSEKVVPTRHKYTVLNFPPKKLDEFNDLGAVVTPDRTSPIGKKNTCNKLISKTWAWKLSPVFALFISWIQRGFAPSRNFVLNILELDVFSRVFTNATRSSLPPAILVFFDLLAAFPTLAIGWLFKVLEATGAPLGFRNYVEAMYDDLLHFVQYRGALFLFGLVTQGVVQGCPLASLLYMLGIHLFSVMFERAICNPKLGLVRQCADDIGALLKTM